jgi:crossover junction endodeoxyribonuclease RuvC
VDPGSLFTGYGVVRLLDGAMTAVEADRLAMPAEWPLPRRLVAIHKRIAALVETHRPEALALEDLFTGENPRSALKLAQARAAALLAGALAGVPVFEYSPSMVKKTVAGSGRAQKDQVARMVVRILRLEADMPPDVSDALAVAICHAGSAFQAAAQPAAAAAGRARGSSWRRLSAKDLADLGFRLGDDQC